MCTLTVIPRNHGYLLAMNRDERLTRADAAPPSLVSVGGIAAVYPRDRAGGTWVAANDRGIALALLNWNDVSQPDSEKKNSRGAVVTALMRLGSQGEVQKALQNLDLLDTWPFRLVGIFPAEKKIGEWRWNHKQLMVEFPEWKPQHWFSSSLSDERAASERGAACASAWRMEDAGSVAWLRCLHACHDNGPGPFSICVHRENVRTVSYTEIACDANKVSCRYSAGNPCARRDFVGPVEMARSAINL